VKGNEFSTKKQNSSYQNYFVQMDFALSPNWHLETGLALNTTQYALEDLFGTGAAPKLAYRGRCHHELEFLYSFTKNKTLFCCRE
jgi:hypothetical protein